MKVTVTEEVVLLYGETHIDKNLLKCFCDFIEFGGVLMVESFNNEDLEVFELPDKIDQLFNDKR